MCVFITEQLSLVFFLLLCPEACPWMWDNLTCWQAANVGEVVVVNCPELFHDFMSPEDGELNKQIK